MKYCTMVMRHGDPKASSNEMSYTLISDELNIKVMSGTELAKAINDSKIVITNMATSAQGLVSTNGAIKNYTTIDQRGNIVGTPRCVILGRIEVNDKLKGYKVFTSNGVVAEINLDVAAKLAQVNGIANGKIRHTTEGDIVASIGGNYPLTNIKEDKKDTKASIPTVDVVFFGSALNDDKKITKFAGITVTSKDATTIASLYKTLSSDNEKLIGALRDKFGYSEAKFDSFKLKQVPGAGFYGVYPLTTVTKIIETVESIKNTAGKIIVGCTDKDEESIALIKSGKITFEQFGTVASDKALEAYVTEVKGLIK